MTEIYSQLDPGIVDTVRLLRASGFDTTDSGDGVSKPAEWYESGEAMPFPNVAASTTTETMVSDADRMLSLLGDGWEVEATYIASDKIAILLATKCAR